MKEYKVSYRGEESVTISAESMEDAYRQFIDRMDEPLEIAVRVTSGELNQSGELKVFQPPHQEAKTERETGGEKKVMAKSDETIPRSHFEQICLKVIDSSMAFKLFGIINAIGAIVVFVIGCILVASRATQELGGTIIVMAILQCVVGFVVCLAISRLLILFCYVAKDLRAIRQQGVARAGR